MERSWAADCHPEDFDRLAERYELYVPWKSRLAREIPFLDKQLRAGGGRRVLDCGCGPGRHAVALARLGFEVTGLDVSLVMLERARVYAQEQGVEVDFVEGRFESLAERLPEAHFDGLLCLGNSLSATGSTSAVGAALREFARVLRPGAIAVTQTVDFETVAPGLLTPSPVRFAEQGDTRFFFVKSFVRVGAQLYIHWVTLENREGNWRSDVTLHPLTLIEPALLEEAFSSSGFSPVERYGDYAGSPFVPGASRDLIIVARKKEG
ncbi:MAG: class I SAM-dependent methyltransferase [Acidobacteriota bacterium]